MIAYRAVLLWLGTAILSACHAAGSQTAKPPVPAASQPDAQDQSLREEIYQRAKNRLGGKEPTRFDLFVELARKASEEAEAAKDYGQARIVPRGASPEIVIQRDQISVNGKGLKLGESLDKWIKALPTEPVCDRGGPRVLCNWHTLGIQVLTDRQRNEVVVEVGIYVALESNEMWKYFTRTPDGRPIEPPTDWKPKNAFKGYLELDGFGIDATTKFWEIRKSADPKRHLRCGLSECSHPHGSFGGDASINMRLTSPDEYGTLLELSVSLSDSALDQIGSTAGPAADAAKR